MSFLSSIPFYDRLFGKTTPEPSPAAQFLYTHKETVITLAISTFTAYRSPGLVFVGSLVGFVTQVIMSQQTQLSESQKLLIEATDEKQTTRNDIIRHVAPLVVGTFVPQLQLVTDTMIGFASGSLSTRKAVAVANNYFPNFNDNTTQLGVFRFSLFKRA